VLAHTVNKKTSALNYLFTYSTYKYVYTLDTHNDWLSHTYRPVLCNQVSSSFQLRASSKQVEWVCRYEEVFRSTDVRALIILRLVNVDTWLFAFASNCCHLQTNGLQFNVS